MNVDNSRLQQLLTICEVSILTGLSVQRLRYEVFLKRIPCVRIGRSVRFTREQIEAWVKSNSCSGGGGLTPSKTDNLAC